MKPTAAWIVAAALAISSPAFAGGKFDEYGGLDNKEFHKPYQRFLEEQKAAELGYTIEEYDAIKPRRNHRQNRNGSVVAPQQNGTMLLIPQAAGGYINPQTGKFYPSVGPGMALDPQTGQTFPVH